MSSLKLSTASLLTATFATLLLNGCGKTQAATTLKDDNANNPAIADTSNTPAAATATAGNCSVTGLTLQSGASLASTSLMNGVTSLKFTIPAHSDTSNAQIAFFQGTAELKAWDVIAALDLYNRQGVLAQLSGAVTDTAGQPVMTIKAYFNAASQNASGFLEITDKTLAQGDVIRAQLESCAW